MITKRCLTILACIAILTLGCAKKGEVSYQGKPLSAWIEMLNDSDPNRKYAAIKAIGEIGQEAKEAIPILVETIRETRNRDKRILVACNDALFGMGREIVPHMIRLLKDDNWEMRRGSAWMLGKLGPDAKDAIPALTEALNDPSEAVRMKAAESLKKIKEEEGELRKPNSAESAFGKESRPRGPRGGAALAQPAP
jgi:HEAT repeat protein